VAGRILLFHNILTKKPCNRLATGNQFHSQDLVQRHLVAIDTTAEPAMNRLIADSIEPIDGKTSRAICDAVGDRLQRDLSLESFGPSAPLQRLLDELRRLDREGHPEPEHRRP
jgi:hypothetical protein